MAFSQSSALVPSAASAGPGAVRTPRVVAWRADRGWLLPLCFLFVLKGALLVFAVGPFTGHDEVDHFTTSPAW